MTAAHLSEESRRKLFPSMYRVLGFGTGAVLADVESDMSYADRANVHFIYSTNQINCRTNERSAIKCVHSAKTNEHTSHDMPNN